MEKDKRFKNRNRKWEQDKCPHRRKKFNWPFGRKSKPVVKCKDCRKTVVRRKGEYGILESKKDNRRR